MLPCIISYKQVFRHAVNDHSKTGRKKIKKEDSEKAFSKVDLDYLIESSIDETDKKNEIEPEIQIFRNVLDFTNIKVKDCMIPRTEIIAVETGTPKKK